MTRKPGKFAVHPFTDGGAIVRGTTDPVLAFKLLLEEHIAGGVNLGGLINDTWQSLPDLDPPVDSEQLAAEVFDWLKKAAPGRFRFQPGAAWGEDWRWCLFRQDSDAKGRGIFSGVEFPP